MILVLLIGVPDREERLILLLGLGSRNPSPQGPPGCGPALTKRDSGPPGHDPAPQVCTVPPPGGVPGTRRQFRRHSETEKRETHDCQSGVSTLERGAICRNHWVDGEFKLYMYSHARLFTCIINALAVSLQKDLVSN